MKSKKMLLILVFAAVLGVGWLVTVRAAGNTEAKERQKELVAEADAYMERELYVRAIPCYEEALTYPLEQNFSIEEKLLDAYLSYGDISSYVGLAQKRAAAGTASEEEYVRVADYLLAQMNLPEAMQFVKGGMERIGSERLEAYFEEHRYAYDIRTTDYDEILPTADNDRMPAFDGEKWGYVSAKGRAQSQFIYDSVLPFNSEGYAVVSLDGTYYTILMNWDKYGVDDGSRYPKMTDVAAVSGTLILGERSGTYSYYNYDFEPIAEGHQYTAITSNACGVAAVQKDGRWGIITDSGAVVHEFTLEDVAVNSLGCAFAGNRAMVKENGGWHLIDTAGSRVGDDSYADAKAPESDGYIAVADSSGKWGYIDRDGNPVIDCRYDDALSFSDGLGAVRGVNDWGYISEKNVPVIESVFSQARPFHNGIAQVELADKAALITLRYFEE